MDGPRPDPLSRGSKTLGFKKMRALVVDELPQICRNLMGIIRGRVMMNVHALPKDTILGCCLLAWMGLGLIPCFVVRRHLVSKICGLLVVNELLQICNNMMGITQSQLMMHIRVLPHNVGTRYKLVSCLLPWMGQKLLIFSYLEGIVVNGV